MVTTRTLATLKAAPALLLALQGCGSPELPALSGPMPPAQQAPDATATLDAPAAHDGRAPRDEVVIAGEEGAPSGSTGELDPRTEPVAQPDFDETRPPPTDRAPTPIVPASVDTDEDEAIEFLLTAVDDRDEEGELVVTIVDGPLHGTLSATEGAAPLAVRFTPDADYAGGDMLRVAFLDSHKHRSATIDVPLYVHAANDAPRVTNTTAAPTQEGKPLHHVVTILDPEGDELAVSVEDAPGWLSFVYAAPSLTLSGEPDDDAVGQVVVTVVAVDGWGARARVPVTLPIEGLEEAPVIDPVAVPETIDEDAPFSLLLRAHDPEDAGPPFWASTSLPTWASLTDYGDGTALLEGTPDDPDHGTHAFAFTVTDVAGMAATLGFSLEVLPVNDAPIAVTDHFYTLGNINLSVQAGSGQVTVGNAVTHMQHFGVLSNDTDVDTAGRFAVAETVASDAGGSATIAVTGSVSYAPPRGFIGQDRFTYRVRDTEGAEGTGDVIVHVAQGAWFVDPVAASDGTGTFAAPMTSIQDALDYAEPGDVVFVRGTSPTSLPVEIVLAPGQTLIGEGAGLSLPLPTPSGIETIEVVPPGPATTLTHPTGDVVTLADNVTLAGFAITGAGGSGLYGDGVGDVTLRQLQLNDNTDAGLRIVDGHGQWHLSGLVVSGGGAGIEVSASPELVIEGSDLLVAHTTAEGVTLDRIGGAALHDVVISSPGGDALRISGSDEATITIEGLDIDTSTTFPLVASDVGQLVLRDTSLDAGHSGALHLSRVGLDAELDDLRSERASGDAIALYAVTGQLDVTTLYVDDAAGAALLIDSAPGFRFAASGVEVPSADQGVVVRASPAADVSLALTADLLATAGDAIDLDDAGSFALNGPHAVTSHGGAACRAQGTTLDIQVRALHASDGDVGILLDDVSGELVVTGDGTNARNGSGGVIDNCDSDSVRIDGGHVMLRQMRLEGAADRGVAVMAQGERDSLLTLAHSEVDDHAIGLEVNHTGGGLVAVHLDNAFIHTTAGANVAISSTGTGDTSVTVDDTQLDDATGNTALDAFRMGAEGALCVAANGIDADKRIALTAEDDASLFVAGFNGADEDDAIEAFVSAANGGATVLASANSWPTPVPADACPLP
jgi:hypothetical protein